MQGALGVTRELKKQPPEDRAHVKRLYPLAPQSHVLSLGLLNLTVVQKAENNKQTKSMQGLPLRGKEKIQEDPPGPVCGSHAGKINWSVRGI